MDVDELIGTLIETKKEHEESIERAGQQKYAINIKRHYDAIEVINTVLKTYEQRQCEWCDGGEHCLANARWTRLLIRGGTMTASGNEDASIDIRFCPICGKPLE